jgi:DNA-binding LytR/AlgR family response regulator
LHVVFKLFIDKSRAEEVTATVHERTALIDEIERLVLQESITDKIPGYEDDTIVMLPTDSVECFYVENDKTYAHCADKRRYLVKKRLYELEKLLPGNFEKINKSAIANWSRVSKLKAELSGVVDVVFSSGHVDCISRRCFSELRRRYGL